MTPSTSNDQDTIRYTVRRYSPYENSRFIVKGHHADVMDKLIRLAAKLTEHYAGDIFYDLSNYEKAIEADQPFDKLLCFRETGITSIPVTKETEEVSLQRGSVLSPECRDTLQYWRLINDPQSDVKTCVYRAHLYRNYEK